MASSDVWGDFDQIRHGVKTHTVDKLKQILSGMNEECGAHLPKSGKKQEIIDRILTTLDSWRAANFEDKWAKAKAILHQVKVHGAYTPARMTMNTSTLPATVHPHGLYNANGIHKPSTFHTSSASTSTLGRYDPYAPPRKPTTTAPVASTSSAPRPTGIRFKESPFFQIEQAVSGVIECPESASATDRRQQILTFSLNNDQIAKLKTPGSKYQLRLFCTSSVFYAGNSSFRTSPVPCPIEFPPTCEVRVNNQQLTANLKGLKKKPGTAPPPDLGKYTRLTGVTNRVEMVYVNSQQPVQSKKFYLVVMLVQTTNVDQLVSNLKASHYKSSQDVKQKMLESLADDDDIIPGPQKMSLKCPLSFMRVNTPCRSSKCVHSQCFDATSWYSMMEQTTTWLCPVCERILDYKDLIIDGYFDEILKQSPESVEDVIVEADSEWHTSDNKYGSATWKALHPPAAPIPLPTRKPPTPVLVTPKPTNGASLNGKGKGPGVEILVLDSDDEDEGRVKRELSPSYNSSANRSFDSASLPPATQTQSQTQSQTQQQSQGDVIDLTLDSDDEDYPPAPQAQGVKRKAAEAELDAVSPTEQIWKKNKLPDVGFRGPGSASLNGVDHSRQPSSAHSSSSLPTLLSPLNSLSPPNRYPPAYATNTLPPMYNAYPGRAGASNGSLQLPPLPSGYDTVSRPSGGSRWV